MTLFEELNSQSEQLRTYPGMSPDEYGGKLELALSFFSRIEELTLGALSDKMAKIASIESIGASSSEKDRIRRISNESQIYDMLNKRMSGLEARISALQSLMKSMRAQYGGNNG